MIQEKNLSPDKRPAIEDALLEVVYNTRLTQSINLVGLHSPRLARQLRPGQFLELRINASLFPLLRRPFSIHWCEGDVIEIMSKVVGIGTELFYHIGIGDKVMTLAPLGNTFGYDRDDFDMAVIISGGIGVAPMALLEKALRERGKRICNILGGRSAEDIVTRHLSNTHLATDDGSVGFKGNVVQLFESMLPELETERIRVFACGPNPMLAALTSFTNSRSIPCEVSIESMMGCGIGICYGCPITLERDGNRALHLLCQVGSVVDGREVIFDSP